MVEKYDRKKSVAPTKKVIETEAVIEEEQPKFKSNKR